MAKYNPAGTPRPDRPCKQCGVEGFVFDNGNTMTCTDCGAAWPTEIYIPEMALKLGDVDREPTYSERVRQVVENASQEHGG